MGSHYEYEESLGDLGYNGFPVYLNYFTALPDVSVLSNSALVIVFKSLLKKDTITKEKSLTELLSLFNNSSSELTAVFQEELTIMSWLQLYPKLATENSKTIRALSHQVQGKFLDTVGGKAFSKYLKSSIAVWLHGIFDNEKAVSNAAYNSLLASFQNDSDRVSIKVWSIFIDQIVNFLVAVVTLETSESLSDSRYTNEEDSASKYERLLNGSLQMITRIIHLSRDGNLILNTENITKLSNVLESEELWNLLGSSSSFDRLNLNLFASLLILVKSLFSTSDLTIVNDSNKVYTLVCKRFIKKVSFKVDKVNPIVYSSVILRFWDCLLTLTKYSSDQNIWQLGGTKSNSRFLNYLTLGPCNSSETYYTLLTDLFKLSPSVIDYKSVTDYESLNSILCSQLEKSVNPKLSHACMGFLLFLYKQFDHDQLDLGPIFQSAIYYSIDSIARVRAGKDDSIGQVSSFLTSTASVSSVLDQFSDSIVELAFGSDSKVVVGSVHFKSSYDKLVDTYFRIIKQAGFTETVTSRIITRLITEKMATGKLFQVLIGYLAVYGNGATQDISEFSNKLADFITPQFIDEPLQLLYAYLKVPSFKIDDKVINNVFAKLSEIKPDYLSSYLETIKRIVPGFPHQWESYPAIYEYVSHLSKQDTLDSQQLSLCFSYLTEPFVFANLIESVSLDKDHSLRFIAQVCKTPPTSLYTHVDSLGPIIKVALKEASSNQDCLKFINLIRDNIPDFHRIVWQYITDSSLVTDFSGLVTVLKSDDIPLEEIKQLISESLQSVSTSFLALSNPLMENIYLVESGDTTRLNESMLVVGKFIVGSLEGHVTPGLLVAGGLISEYINDYLLLHDSDDIDNVSSQLVEIRRSLIDAVSQRVSHDNAILYLTNQLDPTEVNSLSILSHNLQTNDSYGFYSARVLKACLDNVFEEMSVKQFEELAINFNALLSIPLKLAAILSSCTKFINHSKLDRIRNYVAAEILGVKGESKILTDGLKWITLCLNFFHGDDTDTVGVEVIPPQRLNLVLNQLTKWLESSLAYETSFISVRVQICRLLIGLIDNSMGNSLPDKLWELVSSVLDENLGISITEPSRIDLRFYTLKLYHTCVKRSQLDHLEDDFKGEVFELFTNKDIQTYDTQANNRAVRMYFEVISRVLLSLQLNIKVLQEKDHELFEVFYHTKFVEIQRVAVGFLLQTIRATQQDLVLEYQLQKSHLNNDEDNESGISLSLTLPPHLIEQIQIPSIPIPMTSVDTCRYIWSWYLLLVYFQDVTYSIRNEYIKQLNSIEAFNSIFDFIFDNVDVSNQSSSGKFLRSLTNSGDITKSIDVKDIIIETYNIEQGFGESINEEISFVLIHLYYLLLKYGGSQAQSWFNGIRDRQLKSQIEKFTTRFISPILLCKLLEEASASKTKLESNDNNLTLKINSITNEIRSVYIIDEQTMEMVIRIPASYPLDNVVVEGPTRLGVKENQWKAWLLASQRVISLTNGSVIDAVELFNRNVNLHFSGFEDCAICYSILHQDLSLPSKTCPTCSNKFHAACLYKWFKSSNSSTCPLCRSAFNFRTSRN
ncbi:uncharacterized protein RJT21DRAFT_88800 [Scheffersomyces amazonensis]|uniref:uncharacterized protein n=1 Tax=Scheffersomyces amazonensis TaxID=1078765 RepID=UPI00315D2BC4